jgi:[ribosomal protein S5]-alanine N-acetyltransferase
MMNLFPNPYTLGDAYEWFNINAGRDPPMNFAICDVHTNTVLGGIGLKPNQDVFARSVEIGYWLGEDSWGKGLMTEAVRAFTDWTFRQRSGILRVWAGIFGGNVASEAVLRRAGYTFEGAMRQMVWKEALGARDQKIWAMIREDWEGLEKKME